MIAQTHCGEEMAPVSTDAGDTRWPVCGPEDGPCPSCLSAHVAKLEAALATAEAQVSRLQAERDAAIDERNAYRSGHQDEMHEADELRGRIRELEAQAAAQAGGVVVSCEELEALNEAADAGDSLREALYEYAEGNMWLPQLRRCDAAKASLADIRAAKGGAP